MINVERGFFRLTAVTSAVILAVGIGLATFDWISSLSSWRAAGSEPPGDPMVYVVGGDFINFPAGFSNQAIAQALSRLEETFQLYARNGFDEVASETAPGKSVAYVYLPGALPHGKASDGARSKLLAEVRKTVPRFKDVPDEELEAFLKDRYPVLWAKVLHDRSLDAEIDDFLDAPIPPPPWEVTPSAIPPPPWEVTPSAIPPPPWEVTPSAPSTRAGLDIVSTLEKRPDVLARSVRKRFPGAYDDLSDEDLAKRIAKRYPQLGRGQLWSLRSLFEDEAREALPAPVNQAMAKLRTKGLIPYASKPTVGAHLALVGAAIGVATIPWLVFFVIRWVARGFSASGPGKNPVGSDDQR